MLGGKWTKYNAMTERVEVLYLKKEYCSEIARAWKLWDKEAANSADGNHADVPELAATTSAEPEAVWFFLTNRNSSLKTTNY